MKKEEYPPLLAPGFTEIALGDLDRLFVEPFDPPYARRNLVKRLRELLAVLQEIGLECEVWIDGSFSTNKLEPSDVDVVILSDERSRARLSVSQSYQLDQLITKKDRTQYRYRCDLSYCARGDQGLMIYYRGLFGFSEGGTAKGIALLRLVAP
jgi:hypothetical protein